MSTTAPTSSAPPPRTLRRMTGSLWSRWPFVALLCLVLSQPGCVTTLLFNATDSPEAAEQDQSAPVNWNLVGRAFALPFTFAVDVATLPLQLPLIVYLLVEGPPL